MQCPVCRQRTARRACPALGRQICSVCCGTKRQAEIACPADCGFLASSQAHPAAVVRRRQERDLLLLSSLLGGLTATQKELLWAVLGFVSRFAGDPLLKLYDEDVADMASSLASTLRTAAKGVIYEHRPRSLAAQRLATELRGFLDQQGAAAGHRFSQDLVAVLERLASAFREAARTTGESGPLVALSAVGRALRAAEEAARADAGAHRLETPTQSPLITL